MLLLLLLLSSPPPSVALLLLLVVVIVVDVASSVQANEPLSGTSFESKLAEQTDPSCWAKVNFIFTSLFVSIILVVSCKTWKDIRDLNKINKHKP